jgi:hypothetical protein
VVKKIDSKFQIQEYKIDTKNYVNNKKFIRRLIPFFAIQNIIREHYNLKKMILYK